MVLLLVPIIGPLLAGLVEEAIFILPPGNFIIGLPVIGPLIAALDIFLIA
jgi:hypothetical protein